LTINDLCARAHAAAVAKGFYERPRELPELLMLIVSELAEAMEADRHGRHCIEPYSVVEALGYGNFDYDDIKRFQEGVKDTTQDELADAFIRLADLCGFYGIDIENHIKAKMAYNETRPRMHGKKY